MNPRARVWRGSHEDNPDQGITILGTPVGQPEFVERELAKILANHSDYSPESRKFRSSRNFALVGLRSAWRPREAVHWAAHHLEIAEVILRAVEARDEVPSVLAINRSQQADVGFVPPSWAELGARPSTLQPSRTGSPRSCSRVIFPGKFETNFVQC